MHHYHHFYTGFLLAAALSIHPGLGQPLSYTGLHNHFKNSFSAVTTNKPTAKKLRTNAGHLQANTGASLPKSDKLTS